jgi:phosphonate transport system substrate-binding protein
MKPPRCPHPTAGRRRWVAALACAGLAPTLLQAQPGPAAAPPATGAAPLRLGLTPFLSPRSLLVSYEPLRLHLQARLGRPVEFYSARDFRALMQLARQPEQPFTLIPVHLALMLVEDAGFKLLALSSLESPLALWAPADTLRTLSAPGALAGRRVATADSLTLASLRLERWRAEQGLEASLSMRPYPNLGAAVLALGRGEVEAVLAPKAALRELPDGAGAGLQLLVDLGAIPTPCWVAEPGAKAVDSAAFRAALLSFEGAGAGGRSSEARYVQAVPADLARWRPYAAIARERLRAPPPLR